ncbi:IS66 family insertion sequence element accessory protein TnpA [Desulfosarcina cetonica]|uniref:IS66 family insertion sequence element accessory protein TnpA n=1 Tax=Desulfosarcina cetonica TaxID=90730 RepID=UPI003BEEBC18
MATKSGLSQRAYCHTHFLKPHRFYYRRRRILSLRPQPEVSFLPVTLSSSRDRHSQAVRILLPTDEVVSMGMKKLG